MFATYLIGLREGLEATLVVSILVAFLVKSDRGPAAPVWAGVAAAVALSVLFGWLLSYTETRCSPTTSTGAVRGDHLGRSPSAS